MSALGRSPNFATSAFCAQRTFAARHIKVCNAGQTGLVQLRLLLTQHSFALAAGDVPRCSAIFNAVIQMHSVKKRNHSIAAVVTAG